MATGRRPSTRCLGLEEAGVRLGEQGEVWVDEYSRSSVPSIHAVGDVTNRVPLTPVAIREGHAFADTVFGKRPRKVDYSVVGTAVFSTPELGTVGLSEQAAKERHAHLDIYRASFRPLKATLSGRDERMLMKLIVDADSDRVLGAHLLGPDAGELVQLLAIAVQARLRKADFDDTIAVHPSIAEELVTMSTVTERWRRED
jgi:glutathione reductase (NADPH)